MSDFDPVPQDVSPAPVQEAPAEVVGAAPSSTEPPVPEIAAESPAVEVAVEPPQLRTTAEGVILSKNVTVSAEGVVLKVED